MEVLLGEAALFSHFFGAGVSDNSFGIRSHRYHPDRPSITHRTAAPRPGTSASPLNKRAPASPARPTHDLGSRRGGPGRRSRGTTRARPRARGMPLDSLDARGTRAAGPGPRRSRRASHLYDFQARPCMHWPLCNATKDAVPTFVSHRAVCLAAPITTILREAKRGWPGFGASAFFFFLAMASGDGVRVRAFGVFSCAPLGLASQRALLRAAGGRRTGVRARAREQRFCGSAALWFLAAVRRPRGSFSRGLAAGLEDIRPLDFLHAQRAPRRAASAQRLRARSKDARPVPTPLFEKSGDPSSAHGTGSPPASQAKPRLAP